MKVLLFIAILLSLHLLVVAQTKDPPLMEMVKTEQAFSKTAEEKSTREAFMAFIADDGLLFRPGAVNGKKWMVEHPVATTDKKQLLAWQPTFAGMAASGDFGFTTGPWEFKADIKDAKPSGYGHFVTVWKKQADGSWKFAVDLGISHPVSGGPQIIWVPTEASVATTGGPVNSGAARKALLKYDREFSADSQKQGAAKSFQARAEAGVRVYRNNNLPQVGKEAAKILTPANTQIKWAPLEAEVAGSGDVAYTHGTYEVVDAGKKVVEKGSYVRIWRKHSGVWKIVIDVTNAH